MRDAEGRLLRTWKDGEARLNAYLEDHAYLVEALLALYEATFEERWFEAARETAEAMIERFGDPERGGFFITPSDHEQLIARRKDVDDHPIPSGNSSAAYGLLRLAALTGERRYDEHASRSCVCSAQSPSATRRRSATCCARSTSTSRRCARSPWSRAGRRRARRARRRGPRRATGRTSCWRAAPRARERRSCSRAPGARGRPAAYVCEYFACRAPVTPPRSCARLL